jgi:hypothetical protein
MKLRIRGNSVRLRLTQSEVAQFRETGQVEEIVEFGLEAQQQFIYSLSSGDNESPTAVYKNNRLTVFVPKDEARQWTQTNQVGICAAQSTGEEKRLEILIEKDYACLEERAGEDDSDAFPHPLAGKAC